MFVNILVIGLALVGSSSLETSTINYKSRKFNSRDFIGAFLRSNVKKLENVLEGLPECNDGTKDGENSVECRATRSQFTGLLEIFQELIFNHDTRLVVNINTNTGDKQTKYKIVTRATEKTTALPESGPGVMKYVFCFVQSSKHFKTCLEKALGHVDEHDVIYRAYQKKFKKVTRRPDDDDESEESKDTINGETLRRCIRKTYEAYQTCTSMNNEE